MGQHCPACGVVATAIVVERIDTYLVTYTLQPDGTWLETDSRQIDTENYEQTCGHCEEFLGGWGEIGEFLVDEEEED